LAHQTHSGRYNRATQTFVAETGLTGRNLDSAADGKRFVTVMPVAAPDHQKTQKPRDLSFRTSPTKSGAA